MTALAEHDSTTAARILTAARELVLKRGVKGLTVAQIAEKAHVGKGTAYLYWGTKEDLLFGLFARDFLTLLDGEIDALANDPELCRPHRLCPRLVRTALERPFVHALHTGDLDLLGALSQQPRSRELLDTLGPAALIDETLRVWRRHRLVRTDWSPGDQAYALRALIAGFIQTASRTGVPGNVTASDPDKVIAAAVTALLGPQEADAAEIRSTAESGLRLLRQRREVLLAQITPKQETKHG